MKSGDSNGLLNFAFRPPIVIIAQTECGVLDMLTVTAAILIRENKVFIGQRKPGKHMAHLWEFPGGKLEGGETTQECLAREMREEFGVQVEIREYFGESVYHYERGTIRLVAYLVDWTAGEMTPADHQDCRWVTFDDLENYEFVPADVPFVQKLRATHRISRP